MVILRGELWWADFGQPSGSVAGFRRPAIVMQSDQLNHSRLRTVVCIPLTSNMIWSRAPGNVVLPASVTGLPMDSVAVGAQITALPKDMFDECVGTLPENYLRRIIAGLDFVIGR